MTDTLSVRVAHKTREARDICGLRLEAVGSVRLPPFSAGAHIDVHLPNGLVRQYSLLNSADRAGDYEIAVLLDAASRGGSRSVHDDIAPGATLTISTPRNHFPLAHDAPGSLLLAGGIGITPLLCMADRLSRIAAPFEMHYCARSRDRAAFVARIEAAPFAGAVTMHYDDGLADQAFDLRRTLAAQPAGTHLYVCGPSGFMEAVIAAAKAQGFASECIHVEYFQADITTSAADTAFEVQIASTGDIFVIPPNASIADILIKAGVDVPVSCEQGVCGTCVTQVIEGIPDHRDHFLTESEKAENDQFTPCCSRAKSARLVLDL